MSTVQFRNCRHAFGASLSYDVVVGGAYPDRRYCLMLSQSAASYVAPNGTTVSLPAPCAYLNIPFPTLDCAQDVINALTDYHLCGVFRDEPISVLLAWENAPDVELTLTR
jgi:hypothetical protein